jgi:mono/diheme cytochrome c family protein
LSSLLERHYGGQAADEVAPSATEGAASRSVEAAPSAESKEAESAGVGGCCKAGDTTPPLDLVKNTPKGQLKNPYNDKTVEIADEGHKKYFAAGCNGCHGGGGPLLTNDIWVYGADDDTLFRLVALGSDGLQKEGYKRVRHETVVGPMPPFGSIVKTSDDLWKVIAWIRSVNPNSMKLVATPAQ